MTRRLATVMLLLLAACNPEPQEAEMLDARLGADERMLALATEMRKGEAADGQYLDDLVRDLYADYGMIEPTHAKPSPFNSRRVSPSAYSADWPYCTWSDLYYEALMCVATGGTFASRLGQFATVGYITVSYYCTVYLMEKNCMYPQTGGGKSW